MGSDSIPQARADIRQASVDLSPSFEKARWGRDSGARMYASSAGLSIFFFCAYGK
jgi:hypothetical protein